MTNQPMYRRILYLFLMFGLVLVLDSASLFYAAPLKAQDSEPSHVCALNELQVLGQDWVHPGTGSVITQDVTATQTEGVVDYTSLIPANTSGGKVLILVLDDFTNKEKTSGLTHGYVVYRVTQTLLFLAGPNQHTVSFVNIPKYDLQNIRTVVENQIIGAGSLGYTHVVLNMSFALVPCDIELSEDRLKINIQRFHSAYNLSDSIIEILDVDLETAGNQAGWEVISLAVPDDSPSRLQEGDIITGFIDVDPENCTAYDRGSLWGFLKDESPDKMLTVCVDRKTEPDPNERVEVRAYQLFTAIRGYSLAQNFAELDPPEPSGETLILDDWESQIHEYTYLLSNMLHTLPLEFFDLSPLDQLIDNLPTTPLVIPVAAAGNYGHLASSTTTSPTPTPLPTPSTASVPATSLAPGSWPTVISISGSTATAPTIKWEYSNSGEVLVPALWYHIDNWYIAGTSFAAPVASVLIGLKAAADPSFYWQDCANADGSNKPYANRPLADVLSATGNPCP